MTGVCRRILPAGTRNVLRANRQGASHERTDRQAEGQASPQLFEGVPADPQERERATSGHEDDEKAQQELPDPGDNAAPYGGTNLHGTNDTSRFSTPPPKNP